MVASRLVLVAAAPLAVALAALAALLGGRGEGVRIDATKALVADPPRTIAAARSLERGVFVTDRRRAVRIAPSTSPGVHADQPRIVFPIVPLDPEVGFVVHADTLEWLPRGLGLQAGDAVLGINDEPVASTGQLLEAVRGTSEGSSVELRVRRASTGEVLSYWVSP